MNRWNRTHSIKKCLWLSLFDFFAESRSLDVCTMHWNVLTLKKLLFHTSHQISMHLLKSSSFLLTVLCYSIWRTEACIFRLAISWCLFFFESRNHEEFTVVNDSFQNRSLSIVSLTFWCYCWRDSLCCTDCLYYTEKHVRLWQHVWRAISLSTQWRFILIATMRRHDRKHQKSMLSEIYRNFDVSIQISTRCELQELNFSKDASKFDARCEKVNFLMSRHFSALCTRQSILSKQKHQLSLHFHSKSFTVHRTYEMNSNCSVFQAHFNVAKMK